MHSRAKCTTATGIGVDAMVRYTVLRFRKYTRTYVFEKAAQFRSTPSRDTGFSPGFVIPVCRSSGKTGTQHSLRPAMINATPAGEYWFPAFAGMTRAKPGLFKPPESNSPSSSRTPQSGDPGHSGSPIPARAALGRDDDRRWNCRERFYQPSLPDLIRQSMPLRPGNENLSNRKRNGMAAMVKPWHDPGRNRG